MLYDVTCVSEDTQRVSFTENCARLTLAPVSAAVSGFSAIYTALSEYCSSIVVSGPGSLPESSAPLDLGKSAAPQAHLLHATGTFQNRLALRSRAEVFLVFLSVRRLQKCDAAPSLATAYEYENELYSTIRCNATCNVL